MGHEGDVEQGEALGLERVWKTSHLTCAYNHARRKQREWCTGRLLITSWSGTLKTMTNSNRVTMLEEGNRKVRRESCRGRVHAVANLGEEWGLLQRQRRRRRMRTL